MNSNFKGMKLTTNDSNLGNAIHIDNTTSKVRIDGCEFNDCGNKGTVISSNGYNVVIENTNIVFTALSSCQGIVVQYESHFEMINSTISNCISSKEGGAFSYLSNLRNFSDENVLIDNCHFKSNKASQNGGAVGIHSSGIIRIINVTFEKNTANYKQQTSLELLIDEDQTQEGKGGALFINPTNKENSIARVESSILIENCVFRNNEALDGSSIYLSGYDQGNKINIKNNEFYSKKGNSNVILTEICTLSYDELLNQNIFKAEDENGVVREDKNILSSDCKFTPRPTHYFTSSKEFTGSSTFSSSGQFTESNTLLITVNDQTSTPQLPLKNVRYSKSFSLSYTIRKSVSYSLSYVSSNTLELIYDEIKGTYTMAVSQMNYYAYFPYIIYFMSPVYIEREITIEMVRKSRISPEQLIGVVCGSTSVFFLILGIIILAWKKRNEVKAQFDEFDDISSSEIEVYSKQDDANANNNNLDENENEHTNPLFTKDYSETLF